MKPSEATTCEASDKVIGVHRMEAVLPIVLAFMLGVFMLVGAGFAQTTHDVAHDTRHSLGFPCH